MAETTFAPYAPAKAVLGVIDRFRATGLPDPLTTGALERVGVSSSMTARTLQALRFLGLIDEGGNGLESFELLRRASTEDFPANLAQIVHAAYLPVFTIVNPATDSEVAVADAFRGYEPAAQREKMLALFRGLCAKAEIMQPSARAKGGAPKKAVGGAIPSKPKPVQPKKPVDPPQAAGTPHQDEPPSAGVDIRPLTAILQQLPREAHWSRAHRDRWIAALTGALDLVVGVEGEQ